MTKGRAKFHFKNKSTHNDNKPDLFEHRIQNPGKRLNIGSRSPSNNADEAFRPGKKLVCPSPPQPKPKGVKTVKKDQITSLVGAPQLN